MYIHPFNTNALPCLVDIQSQMIPLSKPSSVTHIYDPIMRLHMKIKIIKTNNLFGTNSSRGMKQILFLWKPENENEMDAEEDIKQDEEKKITLLRLNMKSIQMIHLKHNIGNKKHTINAMWIEWYYRENKWVEI